MKEKEVATTSDHEELDELSCRLRREAEEALENEPELCYLLQRTVLAPNVSTFEEAVAETVSYRLLLNNHSPSMGNDGIGSCFCPNELREIFLKAFLDTEHIVLGHTVSEAVREDALAVCRRDPACDTILEVVLFYKGFSSLVCYRAANQKWIRLKQKRRSFTALWLQSQASAVFGLDIHPAATIGAGILFDHGTGVVIGETARIGHGCTMLHGVTLGGTGKETGDRHPKVGNHVLIGAGASILGNITVGNNCKIGAGSVVLRPIPAGATAVGAPAKIIGRVLEPDAGEEVDDGLRQVGLLHKEPEDDSDATVTTEATTTVSSEEDDGDVSNKQGTVQEDSASMRPVKTQHKRSPSKSKLEGDLCPYREYTRLAKFAPPETVTITTMFQLFESLPASHRSGVGAAFLELDNNFVGYIPLDVFHTKASVDIISRNLPNVKREIIENIVMNYGQSAATTSMGHSGDDLSFSQPFQAAAISAR